MDKCRECITENAKLIISNRIPYKTTQMIKLIKIYDYSAQTGTDSRRGRAQCRPQVRTNSSQRWLIPCLVGCSQFGPPMEVEPIRCWKLLCHQTQSWQSLLWRDNSLPTYWLGQHHRLQRGTGCEVLWNRQPNGVLPLCPSRRHGSQIWEIKIHRTRLQSERTQWFTVDWEEIREQLLQPDQDRNWAAKV